MEFLKEMCDLGDKLRTSLSVRELTLLMGLFVDTANGDGIGGVFCNVLDPPTHRDYDV